MSQQINLYNATFVPKRELLTGKNLAIAAGVLYLGLAAVGSWAGWQAREKAAEAASAQAALTQAQTALEAARVANEARKPSAALQADIERSRALLGMRDDVLKVLHEGMGEGGGKAGAGFGDYLTGLARQSREGLWLTGFTVAAGGSGMILSGRTLDKAMLPEYVRRLNGEPAFSGKSFAGLQMDYRELAPVAISTAIPTAPTSATVVKDSLPPRYIEFRLVAESLAVAEKTE